ncbi:hypothetical protein SSX86_023066 [Deinandra increscens subsp. villosa]|uniref:Ubiquitin-like protease family profile domain-containing protein n=1 Tax=Deinandra increscens subsp. villosa TaxID=3103831 RepID=A0AAP0CK62_9ASTR
MKSFLLLSASLKKKSSKKRDSSKITPLRLTAKFKKKPKNRRKHKRLASNKTEEGMDKEGIDRSDVVEPPSPTSASDEMVIATETEEFGTPTEQTVLHDSENDNFMTAETSSVLKPTFRKSGRLALKALGTFTNTVDNPVDVENDESLVKGKRALAGENNSNAGEINKDSKMRRNKGKTADEPVIVVTDDSGVKTRSRSKGLERKVKTELVKKGKQANQVAGGKKGKDSSGVKKEVGKKGKKGKNSSQEGPAKTDSFGQGKVKEYILDYINADREFREYDWCKHILQTLKTCKDKWLREDLGSVFVGPLTILTMIYVDSFECEGIKYDDSLNAISFWTREKLKAREALEIKNGGFGKGKQKKLSKVVDDGTKPISFEEELVELGKDYEALLFKKNRFNAKLERMLEMHGERNELLEIESKYEENLLKRNGKSKKTKDVESTANDLISGVIKGLNIDQNTSLLDDVDEEQVGDDLNKEVESNNEAHDEKNDDEFLSLDNEKQPDSLVLRNNEDQARKETDGEKYDEKEHDSAGVSDDMIYQSEDDNMEGLTVDLTLGEGDDVFRNDEKADGLKNADAVNEIEEGEKHEGSVVANVDNLQEVEVHEKSLEAADEQIFPNQEKPDKKVISDAFVGDRTITRNLYKEFEYVGPPFSLGMTQTQDFNQDMTSADVEDKATEEASMIQTEVSKEGKRAEGNLYKEFEYDGPPFSLGMTQTQDSNQDMTSADVEDKATEEASMAQIEVSKEGKSAEETDVQDKETGVAMGDDRLMVPIDAVPLRSVPSWAIQQLEEKRRNPMREIKPTAICKSPWIERAVVLDEGITKDEEAIWKYLFRDREKNYALYQNKDDMAFDDSELVFSSFNNVDVDKGMMKSLDFETKVHRKVIDAWVEVLNRKEQFRSSVSPHRLFCGTQLIKSWMLSNLGCTNAQRIESIIFTIGDILEGLKQKKKDLNVFDLLLIPVSVRELWYLMVFDLKNPSILVIDNFTDSTTPVSLKDAIDYHMKDSPYKVKDMIVRYLEFVGHKRALELKEAKIHRLKITWPTQKNVLDCAIFLMRHMEKFMGGGEEFEAVFSSNGMTKKKQVKLLRKKYAFQILCGNANKMKDVIRSEALRHF